MSERQSASVNPSPAPTPREMSTVLDDLAGQAIFATAVELDQVLRQYDYRQVAHRFAEQLRREGPQKAASIDRRGDSILVFPVRRGPDRAN